MRARLTVVSKLVLLAFVGISIMLAPRASLTPNSTVPDPRLQYGTGLTVGSSADMQIYYVRGRTLVNRFDLASNNITLVFFGQSNFSNVNPTTFTPVNGAVYNFSPVDGAIYANGSPTIGTSTGEPKGYGCTALRIADTLITNGNAGSVVVADSAIGGTTISPTWASDANHVISGTFAALKLQNLTPAAVLFGQGESDTGGGTSQAAYAASLTSFIANVRATGYAGPIFIAHQSWNAGATSTNVTNAQDAAVNHPSGIWAGPNADSITGTSRQADNTHFNDAGAATYAAAWITALHAFGAPF